MILKGLKFLHGKFWSKLFARFILGGAAGVLFQFIITWGATTLLGTTYRWPYALAMLATTIFNFLVAIKFIFKLDGKQHITFAKYLVSVVVFYFMNLYLVEYFRLKLPTILPAPNDWIVPFIITTGIMFVIKFLIYDRYVFTKNEKKQEVTL